MEFRKMVTTTLYARQQKRHRCLTQPRSLLWHPGKGPELIQVNLDREEGQWGRWSLQRSEATGKARTKVAEDNCNIFQKGQVLWDAYSNDDWLIRFRHFGAWREKLDGETYRQLNIFERRRDRIPQKSDRILPTWNKNHLDARWWTRSSNDLRKKNRDSR